MTYAGLFGAPKLLILAGFDAQLVTTGGQEKQNNKKENKQTQETP